MLDVTTSEYFFSGIEGVYTFSRFRRLARVHTSFLCEGITTYFLRAKEYKVFYSDIFSFFRKKTSRRLQCRPDWGQ